MISENIAQVENKIDKACEKAGRDRKDVTLIAVSKTKPLPLLQGGVFLRLPGLWGKQSTGADRKI